MIVELSEKQIISKSEKEHLKRVEQLNSLEHLNNIAREELKECLRIHFELFGFKRLKNEKL